MKPTQIQERQIRRIKRIIEPVAKMQGFTTVVKPINGKQVNIVHEKPSKIAGSSIKKELVVDPEIDIMELLHSFDGKLF